MAYGNPFGQQPTTGSPYSDLGYMTPDQGGIPNQGPRSSGGGGGIESMMQDPRFQAMIQQLMRKKKQQQGGIEGLLKGGGGQFANLGKQLPRLKQVQEQWKIQDAERKAKKLKIDFLTKQAEGQANQQQIQSAQNSV